MKPHLVFQQGKWWVVVGTGSGGCTLVHGRATPQETIERWAAVNKRYWRPDECE